MYRKRLAYSERLRMNLVRLALYASPYRAAFIRQDIK